MNISIELYYHYHDHDISENVSGFDSNYGNGYGDADRKGH